MGIDNHKTKPATRSDVARLAGVSTAVVSYVVNNGPRNVSAKTHAKVLKAIKTLNYRPNPNARALKIGSTGMIGLLVPNIISPFHCECVEAIDRAASAKDYSLILASTYEKLERESLLVSNLVDRGTDGLIFLTALKDERLYSIADQRIPRVRLDCPLPYPGLATVGPNELDGIQIITNHIIEHGHENIGFITGPFAGRVMDLRHIGWQMSLQKANLAIPEPQITSWDREGGYRGAYNLMQSANPPTAIVACSDLIAVGVLQALREMKLSVPQNVAVVSYDGTAESEYSFPALTTIRHPFNQMAKLALDWIAQGVVQTPEHKIFDMELIIRESCGCTTKTTTPTNDSSI